MPLKIKSQMKSSNMTLVNSAMILRKTLTFWRSRLGQQSPPTTMPSLPSPATSLRHELQLREVEEVVEGEQVEVEVELQGGGLRPHLSLNHV